MAVASPEPGESGITTQQEREDRVLMERLVAAGFNEFQADALLHAHVDCHLAVEMLEQGCHPDLAVDILL